MRSVFLLLLLLIATAMARGTSSGNLLLHRQPQARRIALSCRGGAAQGGSGSQPAWARPAATRQTQELGKATQATETPADTRFAAEFLLRDRRLGFMKKVYLTLSVQVAFTGLVVCYAGQYRATLLKWLLSGEENRLGGCMLLSFLVAVGSSTTLFASERLRRGGWGYLLTAIFTIAESVMVAGATMPYTVASVAAACFQTALATGGLTLYAFQTNPKYDLSGVGSALTVSTLCLLGLAVMKLVFNLPLSDAIYSTMGALLFCGWIVYDTYRIIGGRHRQSDQISAKDHLLGSTILYMDIVSLFLHLLRLFGERDS